MRPRMLDLFCKAGGAATGYHRAGFEVVGVDIEPQPNYPFEFYQADALNFPLVGFDAIHGSPPCLLYTTASATARHHHGAEYQDLVAPIRERLRAAGVPYVIENVIGSPLEAPVQLCGSAFGLNVRRHRLFELGGWTVPLMPPCAHHWQKPRFRSLDSRRTDQQLASVVGVHGHIQYAGEFELRKQAMGIDWMTPDELAQAIPPAYTQFIGEQLMSHLALAVGPP